MFSADSSSAYLARNSISQPTSLIRAGPSQHSSLKPASISEMTGCGRTSISWLTRLPGKCLCDSRKSTRSQTERVANRQATWAVINEVIGVGPGTVPAPKFSRLSVCRKEIEANEVLSLELRETFRPERLPVFARKARPEPQERR